MCKILLALFLASTACADPAILSRIQSFTATGARELTQVPTPAAPTVTPQTAGGGRTWTYAIQAKTNAATSCTSVGHITGIGIGGTTDGTTTDGALDITAASQGNGVSWTAVAGATGGYCIYRTSVPVGSTPSTTGLIATTIAGVVTYTDAGARGDGTNPSNVNSTAHLSNGGAPAIALTDATGGSSVIGGQFYYDPQNGNDVSWSLISNTTNLYETLNHYYGGTPPIDRYKYTGGTAVWDYNVRGANPGNVIFQVGPSGAADAAHVVNDVFQVWGSTGHITFGSTSLPDCGGNVCVGGILRTELDHNPTKDLQISANTYSGANKYGVMLRHVMDGGGVDKDSIALINGTAVTDIINFGSAASPLLGMSRTLTSYGGITTAGLGVPVQVGVAVAVAQIAAIGGTTLFTVGAANSMYHVSAVINCTTASAGATVNVTIAYTDTGSQAQTITLGSAIVCTTLGSASVGNMEASFNAKAATTISYSTAIVNAPTYDIRIVLDQRTVN